LVTTISSPSSSTLMSMPTLSEKGRRPKPTPHVAESHL
jgi:hypothetical protein